MPEDSMHHRLSTRWFPLIFRRGFLFFFFFFFFFFPPTESLRSALSLSRRHLPSFTFFFCFLDDSAGRTPSIKSFYSFWFRVWGFSLHSHSSAGRQPMRKLHCRPTAVAPRWNQKFKKKKPHNRSEIVGNAATKRKNSRKTKKNQQEKSNESTISIRAALF